MRKIFENKIGNFLFLSSACFLLGFLCLEFSSRNIPNAEKLQKSTSTLLQQEESNIRTLLESCDQGLIRSKALESAAEGNGFSLLIFQKDSLAFWSDNRTSFQTEKSQFIDGKFQRYKNGWYSSYVHTCGETTMVGLLLIKNEYSYQNKYLRNDFNPIFKLPALTQLCEPEFGEAIHILSSKNKNLFSISIVNAIPAKGLIHWLGNVLYILSAVFLSLLFHLLGKSLSAKSNSLRNAILFFVVIIALRIITILFSFPKFLYAESIFNPRYFASSSYLSSLGDLLINSLILFYMVSFAYKRLSLQTLADKLKEKTKTHVPIAALFVFLLLLLSLSFFSLLRSLVINSSISFDLNNVFSLDRFSLYSFISMGLLFSILFLAADSASKLLVVFKMNSLKIFFSLLLGISAYVIFASLFDSELYRTIVGALSIVFGLSMIASVYYLRFIGHKNFNFSHLMPMIVLISFASSLVIFAFNEEKERDVRILLAEKLDNEQDRIAEHLFNDMEPNISSDSLLLSLFDSSENTLPIGTGIRRLHQIYFNGYWTKYDSKLHAYDSDGTGLFNSNNENVGLDYFNNIIASSGIPTLSPHFILLKNSSGRTSYIARIPVRKQGKKSSPKLGTIIVELDSKPFQEQSGLPDLLVSDDVADSRNVIPSDYSYARYKDGLLADRYGSFQYSSNASAFGLETNRFVENEKHSHYLYASSNSSLVVISRMKIQGKDFVILFSYLFAFFSIFFLILSASKQLPVNMQVQVLKAATFSGRIQRVMMLVVLLSMVITGIGTGYYIIDRYDTEQVERVRQRTNSMLVALQNQFGERADLNMEVLRNQTYDLMTLSVSAATDYNVYDMNGNMLFSTQPKIFEQEVISRKMDASAIYQLRQRQKSSFIHDENIGKLKFIASYEALRNSNNQIIGYVGLPYFSNQSELNKEISSFLVTMINIYVFLLVIALLLSYFATERITLPLRLIRQRIGQIRIGERNELLEWNSEDEIGELIREYNRMLIELEKSAVMLARSERESAWREMARQVAHEIKNPLTPMKLSIQHLQRAWNEKSPQLDSIMNKISGTIIQQIDTLSTIASEFSNFAQMPKAKNDKVDIEKIIRDSAALFSEDPRASISIHKENEMSSCFVFGDKDQLSRVFTNLLSNAYEAMREEQTGLIAIHISKTNHQFLIKVSDNGTGISEDLKDKIFNPNFTTKSSGMGLGLAMVKSIVESSGGTIRFESNESYGTDFYLELPAL